MKRCAAALALGVLVCLAGYGDGDGNGKDAKLSAEVLKQMQTREPQLLRVLEYEVMPIDKEYSLFIGVIEKKAQERSDLDKVAGMAIFSAETPLLTFDTLPLFTRSFFGGYRLRSLSRRQIGLDTFSTYTYIEGESRINFFFDIRQKKNLGKKEYVAQRINSVVAISDTAWCATNAWDNREEPQARGYLLKVPLGKGVGKPELVTSVGGTPIPALTSGRSEEGKVVFSGETVDMILSGGEWHLQERGALDKGKRVDFPRPFELSSATDVHTADARTFSGLPDGYKAAVAPGGVAIFPPSGSPEFALMENFSRDLYRKWRPQLAAEEEKRSYPYELENGIGGWDVDGNRLVFGTDFYDAEGITGIGAIGYFDFASRRYQFEFLPELAEWSTKSLVVDGDVYWMGLVYRREGDEMSGGLLRYNKKTKAVKIFDVPRQIGCLVKHGRYLLIGTSEGLYILENERLTRVQGSVDVDGKPCVDVGPSPKTKKKLEIGM